MSTLADFVDALSAESKSRLVTTFFEIWSRNGFGTMTKKDTELLLFRCLADLLGEHTPATNFQWAQLLRVTPRKVKTLRLESHLRFGHLFSDPQQAGPGKYFQELHDLQLQLRADESGDFLRDVRVSFVLEDPVAQMELENELKEIGTYLDFHRNREVVRLRFVDFLKIVRRHAPDDEGAVIDGILEAELEDATKLGELQSTLEAREFLAKGEADKLLDFVDLLGETFAARPKKLVDHLRLILRAGQERRARSGGRDAPP